MNHQEPSDISHVEIYHKLGKLEALMEVICNSHREFTQSVKDLHQRIDAVEARIAPIEQKQSSNSGSVSTIVLLTSLIVAPIIVGFSIWYLTKSWDRYNEKEEASLVQAFDALKYTKQVN